MQTDFQFVTRKEKLKFKDPYQNQVNEQAAEGQRRGGTQGGNTDRLLSHPVEDICKTVHV